MCVETPQAADKASRPAAPSGALHLSIVAPTFTFSPLVCLSRCLQCTAVSVWLSLALACNRAPRTQQAPSKCLLVDRLRVWHVACVQIDARACLCSEVSGDGTS